MQTCTNTREIHKYRNTNTDTNSVRIYRASLIGRSSSQSKYRPTFPLVQCLNLSQHQVHNLDPFVSTFIN